MSQAGLLTVSRSRILESQHLVDTPWDGFFVAFHTSTSMPGLSCSLADTTMRSNDEKSSASVIGNGAFGVTGITGTCFSTVC
jgi:hypothetical protein